MECIEWDCCGWLSFNHFRMDQSKLSCSQGLLVVAVADWYILSKLLNRPSVLEPKPNFTHLRSPKIGKINCSVPKKKSAAPAYHEMCMLFELIFIFIADQYKPSDNSHSCVHASSWHREWPQWNYSHDSGTTRYAFQIRYISSDVSFLRGVVTADSKNLGTLIAFKNKI